MNARLFNIISFSAVVALFIFYCVVTFSTNERNLSIGDIPVDPRSVMDVAFAATSLYFVYQFLYEEKKRNRMRMVSTIMNVVCIAYILYTLFNR
ncbi:MAG: hypothetical protein ACOZCO_16480 [Bacteroidota bacterium]